MIPGDWLNKPYYSLDAYCKKTFSHKCYRLALNAHLTCPNRDGTVGSRGCIFCSLGGSGEFAVGLQSSPGCTTPQEDISVQIGEALSYFGDKKIGSHFIGYFQAYTNTYGPTDYLESVYTMALNHPDICGISIATRPDCLSGEVLDLLSALKARYAHKFIWVELGLQTIHETTAEYIRRGYSLPVFENAMEKLAARDIPVIVHTILGLPFETNRMQLATIDYLNAMKPFGIKLQLLHVLKDTDLATEYQQGKFELFTKEEYLNLLIDCLEHLHPDIVIHRLTGDGPKNLTLAPLWSLNKRDVLNSLHRTMLSRGSFQGRQYKLT